MAPQPTLRSGAPSRGLLWDLLTFDRLITGPVVHLIYWAGLGVIVLMGFGVVGTAIGLALREATLTGALLAIPALVAGLLIAVILALLWRAICEFYVAIFRISDDLRALRLSDEALRRPPGVRASVAAARPGVRVLLHASPSPATARVDRYDRSNEQIEGYER